ncbi:shikimate kinase [Flavobacterium sediminis]|uniref:Shikimate kinase n=1 Tax=Flavobacterium sediminis TaxID=2201181 RepID=A0A2U8QSI8_9FLAO|nr:shikimate kinase [Flavobacterium sediminis]AWM12815.1 shikimate kinase [Flavobacterium sediminis]
MEIILIGYMGSGKSTIGKILSEKTEIPFFDLDQIIEEKEKMTVKEIFQRKGEIYFRKVESLYFNDFVANNDHYILSLGGGTPCYANNHEKLQLPEIASFYLKVPIADLVKRLTEEKENRPLVAQLNVEELEDYIRKHLFDRNFYYHQAKHTIDASQPTDEVVAEILRKLT